MDCCERFWRWGPGGPLDAARNHLWLPWLSISIPHWKWESTMTIWSGGVSRLRQNDQTKRGTEQNTTWCSASVIFNRVVSQVHPPTRFRVASSLRTLCSSFALRDWLLLAVDPTWTNCYWVINHKTIGGSECDNDSLITSHIYGPLLLLFTPR